MRKMVVGLAVFGAVCSASADVVTNTWISPAGGYWLATNEVGVLVNWAGELTDASAVRDTVADFALDDGAAIRTSRARASTRGMLFRPADEAASDDPAAWPTWYLKTERDHADFYLSAPAPGSVPLRVENGRLVFGDDMNIASESALDLAPIRKEGNGDVRFSRFYRSKDAGRALEIAEGTVYAMQSDALAYTDVRVTDPAGAFVFTNHTAQTGLGSLTPQPGVPQPLNGVELRTGTLAATTVPGEVCGTGRVTAVVRSVFVTNVAPHVVYGASAGRLRLDTTNPAAEPFARYDFEASLTADASGHGRDLTAEGAVERVYDAERGGYVARFTATEKTGGRLVATVSDAEGLTGDADYTVSFWAKTAAPCANNWPTFFSLGQTTDDHRTVQFRFMDASCTKLLLGHWNEHGDFKNIVPSRDATTWNPAVWHHYVAMREGGVCTVWVDGTPVLRRRDTGLAMTLPKTVQITLGALVGWQDRFFHGDLDDVRVYAHALGTDGVARLFAGGEPIQDGKDPAQGDAPTLPEGTRLALDLNGAIQLAGAQTLAATNVTATGPRGTLDLPTGGTLTLTGAGTYPAGISGTGRFVKDGDGRLVLSGALAQTGGTEVKAGTLALQNDATQPPRLCAYDFERGLGVDSTGGGFDLTTQAEVERVWDDERGGYVAQFPGTAGQKLEAWIQSGVLTGDADYTLSVWAKPDADCPTTGTLLSLGRESNFKEVVFRFEDIASGTMVLSHWGEVLDFTNVPTHVAPQGAWHHYAAVRRGAQFTVYVDGVETWTTSKAGKLALEAGRALCLGRQVNKTDRQFKGRLDDVAVYACALDAAEIDRLRQGRTLRAVARGARVDALARVPAPVLHYAFERAEAPGFDSAPGAHHLVKDGEGTFTLVDSPLGGKALQFDAYKQACLKSAAFPDVIPADGRPFTVSLWVQTSPVDCSVWLGNDAGNHTPSFVCWGDPAAKTIDFMLSYGWELDAVNGFASPRCYVGGVNGAFDRNGAARLSGLREAAPERRWHHYATVYDPKSGIWSYIDGVYLPEMSQDGAFAMRAASAGNVFYLGTKSSQTAVPFRGALDEVKVFAAALDERQVRAVMRADAGGLHVLPQGGDVTVAEGATLEVNGTEETLGALAGRGTVDLVSGTLALTNAVSAFDGALTGDGTLRLAAGADLTLATAPTAFTGYVDLAGGTLTLPEGVGTIPATFRVTPVDTARETVCAGDVEIPDGTALALTAAYRGPFVTARGRVVVCGGGSVTLSTPAAVGTWVIGQGVEDARDDGAGALADRWRVTNLPALRTARFQVSGGTFLCTIQPQGTVLLLR